MTFIKYGLHIFCSSIEIIWATVSALDSRQMSVSLSSEQQMCLIWQISEKDALDYRSHAIKIPASCPQIKSHKTGRRRAMLIFMTMGDDDMG